MNQPSTPELDGVVWFHVAEQRSWDAQAAGDSYAPAAFASEGFIHCSYARQVPGVYQRYYAPRHDLVVLTINPRTLAELVGIDKLREEPSPSTGDRFPHLYARLPLDAIADVEPWPGPFSSA